MIFEITDIIPFSKRHKNEVIKDILLTDSGYIKTLIEKNADFVLSESAYSEAKEITAGYKDNWKPQDNSKNLFDKLKPYGVPFLFDFNNDDLEKTNKNKIKS